MMDYEIFKEVVAEKMPSFLPGELRGREVMIYPVDKINQTLDGLILKLNGENEKVSPTIYINDMYEHYKQYGDLQLTLETVGEAIIALYDVEGKVCGIYTETITEAKTIRATEIVCAKAPASCKVFVWEDLETVKPLVDARTISIEQ